MQYFCTKEFETQRSPKDNKKTPGVLFKTKSE